MLVQEQEINLKITLYRDYYEHIKDNIKESDPELSLMHTGEISLKDGKLKQRLNL